MKFDDLPMVRVTKPTLAQRSPRGGVLPPEEQQGSTPEMTCHGAAEDWRTMIPRTRVGAWQAPTLSADDCKRRGARIAADSPTVESASAPRRRRVCPVGRRALVLR